MSSCSHTAQTGVNGQLHNIRTYAYASGRPTKKGAPWGRQYYQQADAVLSAEDLVSGWCERIRIGRAIVLRKTDQRILPLAGKRRWGQTFPRRTDRPVRSCS